MAARRPADAFQPPLRLEAGPASLRVAGPSHVEMDCPDRPDLTGDPV